MVRSETGSVSVGPAASRTALNRLPESWHFGQTGASSGTSVPHAGHDRATIAGLTPLEDPGAGASARGRRCSKNGFGAGERVAWVAPR